MGGGGNGRAVGGTGVGGMGGGTGRATGGAGVGGGNGTATITGACQAGDAGAGTAVGAAGLSNSDSSEGNSVGSEAASVAGLELAGRAVTGGVGEAGVPAEGVGAAAGRSWAASVAKSSGEITLARRAASSCCSSVGAGSGVKSSGWPEKSVIATKIRPNAAQKHEFRRPLKHEQPPAPRAGSPRRYAISESPLPAQAPPR